MLFVRCKEGISHHPDESATEEDIGIALAIMQDFLKLLGNNLLHRVSAFDVIIRNGSVVGRTEVARLDLGISGGQIVALEPEIAGSTRETIDAKGLHIFPGVIDSHVHFNDPGRAEWRELRRLAGFGSRRWNDVF